MKKFISAFALSLLTVYSFAQDETVKGGGGGFTIGYGYMDISELDKFITANTGSFSENHILLGGEGYGMIGNFLIGGGGMGILSDEINMDSIKARANGGMGTFNIGYAIVNREKIKFFPMLGIGGGGYGISITKNRNISVDDIVEDPGREINITKGQFILDFSLNLNFIPALVYDEANNSDGGFMTGLKIGYIGSVPSSNWQFSGGDISGGPEFGMSMVYAKLIIGGFGRERKQ